MLTIPKAVIIAVLLIGPIQGSVSAQPTEYAGPSCIGEFCFNVSSISKLMTEAAFVQKYGKGHKEQMGDFAAYCFKVPKQKLYVRFRPYIGEQRQIIDIFISDAPSCPSALPPKMPFTALSTKEGLRIGDTYKRVVALYGEPDVKEKAIGIEKIGMDYQEQLISSPFGDTVLRYLPTAASLLSADIYLRKGKVSAILISMSP